MDARTMIQPGEWPVPRRDLQLSGHCPAPGAIAQPALLWRHHLGRGRVGGLVVEDVDGDGCMEVLRTEAGHLIATTIAGEQKWATQVEGPIVTIADVDADGRKEIVLGGPVLLSGIDGAVLWRTPTAWAPHWRTHVGRLDPARPGLQIAVVTERQEYNSAHFFVFEEGAEAGELVWENEFNKGGVWAHATSMVGDVDGDGVGEICTAVQGAVVVLDLHGGGEKYRFEWEAGGQQQRNYGQCCVADVDGDGINEIVVMDDLIALQVVVIKVEDGQARALWSKYWGWWYPFSAHLLHFVPLSVCDVDGDGQQEVVLSIYDEGWRVHLYDGVSGALKLEQCNSYLESVCDIDGDGHAELLVSQQHSPTPREYADLAVVSCRGGVWTPLWQRSLARLEADTRVEYGAGMGSRSHDPKAPYLIDVDGAGRRAFLLAVDDDQDAAPEAFMAVGPDASGSWGTRAEWAVDGDLELAILGVGDLAGKGRQELLLGDNQGRVQLLGSDGSRGEPWAAGGGFCAVPVVADLDGDGRNEIVVPGADGWIQAFATGGEGPNPLRLLWRYRGWGIAWSAGGGDSVFAVDLDGDGRKEVLVGTRTGAGNAALALLDSEGSERWVWEVPGMAAATGFPSVHRWTVGNFNGDGVLDVYVCARWTPFGGAGSSNESWALDGCDGTILWHNDGKGTDFNLHHCLGPTGLPSIGDVDGDGIDDILMMSLDSCVVLNGRDGSFLQPPTSPTAIFGEGAWTAYGSIVFADLDGDGQEEQLSCANHGIWGAMSRQRQPLWMLDPGPEMMAQRHGGLADVDGDGALELAVAHPGEVRCYAAATGMLKWSESLVVDKDIASADIDGDGVGEFIVAGACVSALKGREDRAEVLWSLDVGAAASAPVIADIDGDGRVEVLVVTGDGFLCAIGPR